jgi:hypothetical protein
LFARKYTDAEIGRGAGTYAFLPVLVRHTIYACANIDESVYRGIFAAIFQYEIERNSKTVDVRTERLRGNWVASNKDPCALFFLHLVKRAPLDSPLGYAHAEADESKKSHSDGGTSGPLGRSALCIAFFLFGVVGLKKGLYDLLDYSPSHRPLLSVAILIF